MTLRSIVVRPFAAGCLSAIILLTSLANPSLRAAEALDPVSIRKQFVLAQEPVGAISLATAKVKCSKAEAANPAIGVPIVIAGRIGARGIEPFLDKKASFVLIEIPADDHAAKPGHKDDDCPFCKKRNANSPMAAVRRAQVNVGRSVPYAAWIDVDDFPNVNSHHFCVASQLSIGVRFGLTFLKLHGDYDH